MTGPSLEYEKAVQAQYLRDAARIAELEAALLKAREEMRERCAKKVESLMVNYRPTGWAFAALESAAFHIRSLELDKR